MGGNTSENKRTSIPDRDAPFEIHPERGHHGTQVKRASVTDRDAPFEIHPERGQKYKVQQQVESKGVYGRSKDNYKAAKRSGMSWLAKRPLLRKCIAEAWGTFFIVMFGVGAVCSAVFAGSMNGLWQVTVVWGFGLTLAILCTASVSGAHLNPAVSFAIALTRKKIFSWGECGAYMLAQMLGGIIGGLVNYLTFYDLIKYFEDQNGIDRGDKQSVLSAMAFGEYFPNPGFFGLDSGIVSPFYACCIEAWGTCILMFMILALTDKRQTALAAKEMAPYFIGFTVACLMSVYTPITQGGFNPARDFGPRIVAAFIYGKQAIPGPRSGFWAYIVGPMVGAPIGAVLYDCTLGASLKIAEEEAEEADEQADLESGGERATEVLLESQN